MSYEVDKKLFEKIRTYLESEDFEFEDRPYQVFLARKNGVVVNLYESGKVVLAGRNEEGKAKLEEYLLSIGAKHTEKKQKEYPPIEISGTRIGTDEAGKGDYFGPLVIAGVLITEYQAEKLKEIGVRDSKSLSDTTIQNLAVSIKRILVKGQYQVIPITPIKYNVLYEKMRNLNGILGWGHARAIENLLMFKEPCDQAIADQFGDQSYIYNALMSRGREIKLIQVPKAEREISVAAASILARSEFINRMREMGETYGVDLPKGASHVLEFAKNFVEKYGFGALQNVAKIHFATTEKIEELEITEIEEEVTNLANTESVPLLYEDKEKENLLLECYNLIRSFEYDFRRFIKRVLEFHHGASWWEDSIEKNIRKKCEKLRNAETKKGRDVDVIDCLDFNHYQMIITDRKNWDVAFSPLFKNKEQLLARLRILKDVRDPVAHSRGSFTRKDELDVILAISYFRGIFTQKRMDEYVEESSTET